MKQVSALFIVSIAILYSFSLWGCSNRRLEMQIKYSIEGCFGSEESEISIYKMQDSTVAVLETKGQKTKQVTLCEAQHPAMAYFLYEFKQVPDKNCYSTTEENYVVTYTIGSEETTLTKKYNCLEWDGFARLKNVLFNFKPIE